MASNTLTVKEARRKNQMILKIDTILQKVRAEAVCTKALTSSKGKKGDNPEAALKDFKSIVEAEQEKGVW